MDEEEPKMSQQSRNWHLPLKNITSTFNTSKMGYSDSVSMTNSPMSNLAFNLSELSTGRNASRRKLTLAFVDSSCSHGDRSGSESSSCEESDSIFWSPCEDSPVLGSSLHSLTHEPFKFEIENSHSRHDNKHYLEDASSQDSGVDCEQDRRSSVPNFDDSASISSSSSSQSHLDRLPSLEDVWTTLDSPSFKTPKGMPPKRSRSIVDKSLNEDTCSPLKYSPIKPSSLPRPSFSEALFFSQIPETTDEPNDKHSSVSNDGFRELFKLKNLMNETEDHLSSLIHAKLLHQPREPDDLESADVAKMSQEVKVIFNSESDTPSGRSEITRGRLHRSQSVDYRPRPSFKRSDPPSESTNPVQNKKWRGDNSLENQSDDIDDAADLNMVTFRRLHRCHSETEAMIKTAISRMYSEPDLLGDCSKTYCLPTIRGRHQDLKSISPDTLSRLMTGEFSNIVEEYHIIDCRYPYEFKGGHILNAVNIYTKNDVMNKYMKSPLQVKDPNKRMILIFHCEFSSERGPGLYRFLRKQDRETNEECYPFLHYPEMYLLEGGYKQFFEQFLNLCDPRKYTTMLDKNHSEDLRRCRFKCRSWSDDKIQSRTGVRNLRF